MARNPRTGEQVTVPAKSVVTFKPGKEMEARVQQLDRLEAAGGGEAAVERADRPANHGTEPGRQ
jgi:hypothetical protein